MIDVLFSSIYENILPIILSLIIVYLLWDMLKPVRLPSRPAPIVFEAKRGFNLEELKIYDGIKEKKVYVAITGTVFDVSSSGFYAPCAPYHLFSGKDASRPLAKNAFVEETVEESKVPLTDEELVALKEWKDFFTQKYRVAGWIVDMNGDKVK